MFRATMIAAAAASALATPVFAADATGLWQTPTNGGQVEIAHCGNRLCGKLMTSDHIKADPTVRDERNRDETQRSRTLKNLQMLYDFTGGPAKWTGGKVYNPDDGGTYSGTIELISDDQLKLKGCIIAPFCKTQVWNRVK